MKMRTNDLLRAGTSKSIIWAADLKESFLVFEPGAVT
jgi:hypothetical protein